MSKEIFPGSLVMPLLMASFFWLSPQASLANGSWAPETGITSLMEAQENGIEKELHHAITLITSGSPRQGARQIRRLLRRGLDPELAGIANYHLGLANFQIGRYKRAFDYLGKCIETRPDRQTEEAARALQLESANRLGEKSPRDALPLFQQLAEQSTDPDFSASARWEMAEMLWSAERCSQAIEAYIDFIDFHPHNYLVSTAWFRIAECQYRIAFRIGRGRQYLTEAESALTDFLNHFPEHERAEQAAEMLHRIREQRALKSYEIAMYYLEIRENLHAAVDQLQGLHEDFSDTYYGKKAPDLLEAIRSSKDFSPRAYNYMPMNLKGLFLIDKAP